MDVNYRERSQRGEVDVSIRGGGSLARYDDHPVGSGVGYAGRAGRHLDSAERATGVPKLVLAGAAAVIAGLFFRESADILMLGGGAVAAFGGLVWYNKTKQLRG